MGMNFGARFTDAGCNDERFVDKLRYSLRTHGRYFHPIKDNPSCYAYRCALVAPHPAVPCACRMRVSSAPMVVWSPHSFARAAVRIASCAHYSLIQTTQRFSSQRFDAEGTSVTDALTSVFYALMVLDVSHTMFTIYSYSAEVCIALRGRLPAVHRLSSPPITPSPLLPSPLLPSPFLPSPLVSSPPIPWHCTAASRARRIFARRGRLCMGVAHLLAAWPHPRVRLMAATPRSRPHEGDLMGLVGARLDFAALRRAIDRLHACVL
jgi:hypothetical protein